MLPPLLSACSLQALRALPILPFRSCGKRSHERASRGPRASPRTYTYKSAICIYRTRDRSLCASRVSPKNTSLAVPASPLPSRPPFLRRRCSTEPPRLRVSSSRVDDVPESDGKRDLPRRCSLVRSSHHVDLFIANSVRPSILHDCAFAGCPGTPRVSYALPPRRRAASSTAVEREDGNARG